ncbi:MAG TPA: family 16 glycoside hydrolase [Candidatus Sulfotelmatobacter sp.]|jgi:mono/diheme cytochrome c family protein
MSGGTNAPKWLWALTLIVSAFLPGRLAGVDKLTYHYNSQRTGWDDHEVVLTPKAVRGPSFGLLWQTPTLDYFEGIPPRLFASPLYVDKVEISAGPYRGHTFPALFVVTSTGFIYSISAFKSGTTAPGTILWRRRLTDKPCDAGEAGNLSTPIIDLKKERIYVTNCGGEGQWQVHAIDIRSGDELPGWPVELDHEALNAPGINRNGTTQFSEKDGHTQRGALNLSLDGARLYVSFGLDNSSGWLVAVDTNRARVATAFSTTPITSEIQGGMWASGGPAVDLQGNVYIATGASYTQWQRHAGIPGVFPESAHSWGQSILQLKDDPVAGFELLGTYTPFNYCLVAANDIDLGSSGTVVIDLEPSKTSTPHLLALGGAKQGNAYLLDRTRMPGGVIKRHPCSDDSSSDLSLLSPENQPQFGKRGPINVFGPYTDEHAILNQARSRTTLAYFRTPTGDDYVYITGSKKRGDDFQVSTPPGLAKLKIVTSPGQPAYLHIDQLEQTQTFHNPGSPIATSSLGGKDAIVWVLDMNAPEQTTLYGIHAPQPILYAFDAMNLKLLWKSPPGVLSPSGKYNEPAVVNGAVFVGTDRVQAFGLRPAEAKAKFKPLFDGKTLNHWRGDSTLWSVRDSAITGRTSETNTKDISLIHDGTYRDFELHFKYRFLTTSGNVSMQYRSRLDPEHNVSVPGYQANVATRDAKEGFAMLSDESARGVLAFLGEKSDVFNRNGKIERRVFGIVNPPETIYATVKPYPAWNDYVVIAYGNRCIHAVNGFLATDVLDDDFDRRPSEGSFALQIHAGPPMGVQFKDIEVKELTAPPDFTGQFVTQLAAAPIQAPTIDKAVLETGRSVYKQRCAMCHSNKQSGAPPKETLTQLPPTKIIDVLVNGLMKDKAVGLGDKEIKAVATYLTSTDE